MATYNNKARITGKDTIVTRHSIPNIRVDNTLVSKIKTAFRLAGDYIRQGEVSKTVKNAVGQYAQNSRCTGRVLIRVPGRKSLVTVDLFSYWPSWSNVKDDKGKLKLDSEGKPIRVYSKEHGSTIITLMQAESFKNPMSQALEHLAYCAIGITKARQQSPREGLIKAQVLHYLEDTGLKVQKVFYRGNEFDRPFLDSKIARMNEVFNAMVKIGEFSPVERKRGAFVVGVEGQ